MTRLAIFTASIVAMLVLASSAAPAPAASPGKVRVDYALTGALFIEGSYTYMRIETRSGKLVLKRQFTGGERKFDAKLKPGRYVLVTYERPCDGNCNYLDPPTARCETRFRVQPADDLRLRIRFDLVEGTCTRTSTRR